MEIIKKDQQTYIIEDSGVRLFLLEGDDKAALIDTGIKIDNLLNLLHSLTSKEIILLNTHADIDHIGSNQLFNKVHIGIHEIQHYMLNDYHQEIIPLYQDDIIDLGNRKLIVIDLSGHTCGSIGFYDLNNKVLISGDPIQKDGRIYMFGDQRSIIGYIESLKRLQQRKEDFNEIWPSHAYLPLDNTYIEKCLEDATSLLNNKLSYELINIHNTTVKAYQGKYNIYLMDNN